MCVCMHPCICACMREVCAARACWRASVFTWDEANIPPPSPSPGHGRVLSGAPYPAAAAPSGGDLY